MIREHFNWTPSLTMAFTSAVIAITGGVTADAETLTATSLSELRTLSANNNNATISLAPGEYWIDGSERIDDNAAVFLNLGGDNNVYNLAGAEIKLDTRQLTGHGSLGRVVVVQISGSNTVVNDLNLKGYDVDLDTDPNAARSSGPGAQFVRITGDNLKLDGAEILTRGSTPYGYGDAFGKGGRPASSNLPAGEGGTPFINHDKASGVLVTGSTNAVVNDLDLTVNAFGHGFFVQGGSTDTTLTNSTVTGELFSTNDVIATPEYQEYGVTTHGNEIPADQLISGGEGGVRLYSGVSGFTVDNVVVTNMRTGFATSLGGGTKTLNNVEAYGTENAFDLGSNTTITNAKADGVNGPIVGTDRDNRSNSSIEVELVGDQPFNHNSPLIIVNGDDLNVTVTSDRPASDFDNNSVFRSAQFFYDNWRETNGATTYDVPGYDQTDSTLINDTNALLILGEQAEGNVGRSQGGVISNGKENFYDGVTLVQDESFLVVTDDKGLGNSGTETGAEFDRNGSVVFTGTATAQTFDDNGTVVADGSTLWIAAGVRVTDEKLTITGDGVDGRGALYSRGSEDTSTRFGSSNGGDQSTIFLDGDASIGVGTSGNQFLVGAIQGNGDLTKKGAGTLVIGKASALDGDLAVEQGHVTTRSGVVQNGLSIAAGASLGQISDIGVNTDGDVTLAGTLDLNERSDANTLTARIGRLDGAGRVTSSNAASGAGSRLTLDGNGADGNFTGRIDGAIDLIKSGTNAQTLSGTLTHTGTTVVNDGELLINGTHTNGGAYTVNGGTLGGSGSISATVQVNDGATLAPGAQGIDNTGTLNLGAGLNLAQGSTVQVEVSGGLRSDLINVTGATTLAGDLELTGANNFPDYRAVNLLSSGGGVTGTFRSVDSVIQTDNTGLAVTYTANTVNVTRARIGDANLDGDVDVFEFSGNGDAQTLTSNLGTTSGAVWAKGDFNGDGDVDVFEFSGNGDAQLLTSNIGFSAASSVSSLTAFAAVSIGDEADTAAAGAASGTYDPTTGVVVIEIGAGVGVVGLESLSGDRLLPANLGDALAASQTTATTIAFFDPTALEEGSFDLGAIVTPGTAVADLGFAFTPLGGDFTTVNLQVAPEPATLAMLAAGGLALLARRRRVG